MTVPDNRVPSQRRFDKRRSQHRFWQRKLAEVAHLTRIRRRSSSGPCASRNN
ncbi:unnamed protein product, partial [Mycena citricolor]